MALDTVADTISEIRKRMNFVPIFCDKSNSITEDIKRHLLTMQRELAPVVEQIDDSNKIVVDENDMKAQDWVIKVTDELTNLFYFLEDLDLPLLPKKRSMIASFFSLHSPLLQQLEHIQKRLSEVAAEATTLSFKNVQKLVNFSDAKDQEIKIIGRIYEKEGYVRMILGKKRIRGIVPVVVISGIHGMGKTKLAKFIKDDENVKREFDLKVWIDDIPDKFYAEFVVKRIIHDSAMKKGKKLEEKEKDYDSVMMDQDNNLEDALRGTKFFLVLDDLRNEDSEEWLKLLDMLKEAPAGGAVVITTQSEIVAKMALSRFSKLGALRDEKDSWSLFEQVVGGGCSKDSKIIEAQKKMVKMCRGVPAAIITMARLVNSREAKNESEICQLKDEFMREMMMRYYNILPSLRLKQCFAYFPFILSKVSYVRVETLIRFWLAEGFLGPVNSSALQQPEDLGLDCIQELCRRSIIFSEENEYGIISKCGMNDNLMQDLAAFVAGDDILRVEDPDNDVKERVHRVLLTSNLDVSNGIPKSLNNKNLCTILLSPPLRVPNEVVLSWSACNAIFCGFKRLRVLTLRDLGMKMLPDSIAELKSLRYLSLARNNLKKLPSAIGELKHLLTLVLSDCHELKELPNEVKYLVSLRHLALEGCLHLERMPSELKKLTCLQTLSHFVTSTNKKKSCSGGLWELISLNNLRGQLEILHLERLQSILSDKDTDRAYLRGKEHLQSLTLRWNHDDDEDDKGRDQDQISLGHLEPHPNLQGLSIVGYEGTEFSGWLLSKFINLVKFSLYNCSKCKKLPPLDQLPKLKILQLQRLDSLEFITDYHDNYELEVADSKLFFPSLRELEISDCPNLTSWCKGKINKNVMFPHLSKLKVNHCPKLDCMPLYPNVIDELFLRCSNMKPLLETLNHRPSNSRYSPFPLSKLKDLRIEIVEQEQQPPLPEEWLKNFTYLKKLSIECKGLKSLMKGLKYLSSLQDLSIKKCTEVDLPGDELEGLKKLRNLYIMEFPKLESLPQGIENLTSLKYLRIDSCPELVSLTEGIGQLKSLTSLCIEECNKLASLPEEMRNLTLLKKLRITNCPMLFPRCQKDTGDNWPQIKHIEQINLFGTAEYFN